MLRHGFSYLSKSSNWFREDFSSLPKDLGSCVPVYCEPPRRNFSEVNDGRLLLSSNSRRTILLSSRFDPLRRLGNDVEERPIGIHAGHWGHSLVEAHEALRRRDPFEDSAGRTHRLMAANHEGTSAAILVINAQDGEP